jgi:hypothetical protein
MVNNGLGQDIWQLTPDQITNTMFVRILPIHTASSLERRN